MTRDPGQHTNSPFDDEGRANDWDAADSALDADLDLVAEYLGGRLTATAAAEVQRRFDEDAEFWENAQPIIAVFTLSDRYGVPISADPAAAFAPVLPVHAPLAAAPPFLAPPLPAPPISAPPIRVAPPIPVAPPITAEPKTPWGPGSGAVGLFRRVVAELRLASSMKSQVIGGLIGAAIATVAILGIVAYRAEVAVQGYLQPGREAIKQLKSGRAITQGQHTDSVANTDATHTRVVPLEGGSLAILRPGSRFSYESKGGLITKEHTSAFDGEGLFYFRQRWSMITALGEIQFVPGIYAIRSDTTGAELLVSVGSGIATAWPIGKNNDAVEVHRGEFLRIPVVGPMLRSTSPQGFPSLVDPRTGLPFVPPPPAAPGAPATPPKPPTPHER